MGAETGASINEHRSGRVATHQHQQHQQQRQRERQQEPARTPTAATAATAATKTTAPAATTPEPTAHQCQHSRDNSK